nr:uncharacterized protein LOC128698992 [Cherax quadricarinatus]
MKSLILTAFVFCIILVVQEKVHGERNIINSEDRTVVDLRKRDRDVDTDSLGEKGDSNSRLMSVGKVHPSISGVNGGHDKDVKGGRRRQQDKKDAKRRRNDKNSGQGEAAGKRRVDNKEERPRSRK